MSVTLSRLLYSLWLKPRKIESVETGSYPLWMCVMIWWESVMHSVTFFMIGSKWWKYQRLVLDNLISFATESWQVSSTINRNQLNSFWSPNVTRNFVQNNLKRKYSSNICDLEMSSSSNQSNLSKFTAIR